MVKALTATSIHEQRIITVTDISAANLEPIVDQAIGIVNTEAGLAMSYLAGAPGAKTVNVEDQEFAIVSTLGNILAINSCLSREDTTWSIEHRNNCAEMVGPDGALTRRYEAMLEAIKSGASESGATGVGLIAWNDPLPSD